MRPTKTFRFSVFAVAAVTFAGTFISPKRAWMTWLCCAVIVLGINCATLTLSPAVWQDEVQIIDFGRVSLPNADDTWSMQMADEGRPVRTPFFLGDVIHDLAFRIFPRGIFGVRFAAQIELILASGALMGWMVANGVLPGICLLSAVLLLVEPTLTQGVRGARVDALAMTFVFLGCWTLAPVRSRRSGWTAFCLLCLAGLSLGVAVLVWPSSVLMVPLFSNQMFDHAIERRRLNANVFLDALIKMASVGLAAVVTVAIMIAFLPGHGARELRDFQDGFVTTAGISLGKSTAWISGIRLAITWMSASFWLLIFPFYAMLDQKRWVRLALVCLTTVSVVASRPYFYRVVYLIPMLIVTSMVTSQSILTDYKLGKRGPFGLFVVAGFLITSLISSVALLGARTYIATAEASTRDPANIAKLAESVIGRGSMRVYIGPWEFYYPGRRLGWKMYRNRPANRPLAWPEMAGRLDYAILDSDQQPHEIDSELTSHGFLKERVHINAGGFAATLGGTSGQGKNYDHDYVVYFRPGARKEQ